MRAADGHMFVLALPALVLLGFWLLAWRDRRRGLAGPSFVARNGKVLSAYLLIAVGFWTIFMIVLPQLFMIELAFRPNLPPRRMGGPEDVYTLVNFRYFLFGSTTSTAEWNTVHLRAFWQTIVASVVITLANLALCYPLAFYMAKVAPAARVRLLLLLLITPYWVNEVLRAFAFRFLFSSGGVVNNVLLAAGLIEAPVDFLGMNVGLYLGLAYAYLLLMVFPLYNALESLDRNQIEAARDLGAPWWHIHAFVVIPFAKPGIASGCTLVFMLTAGSLAVPQLLGGPRSLWFTPVVYDRFYQTFNWPQGAAYALVLLLTCVVFVLGVLRLGRLNLGEITR
jgi:spermidine/putrescine transport system permease protein